jgi:SAM-dependent methyltransferase
MTERQPARTRSPILESVAQYYAEKLERFGPTARGVDWNSSESQTLRFEQLLRLDEAVTGRSIVDYGCGYGALLDCLAAAGRSWTYTGYDVSDAMIARARALHDLAGGATFTSSIEDVEPADYAVASGIFNLRLHYPAEAWRAYVHDVLDDLNRLGTSGFAFNMLTTNSDPARRRSDLYYGNPTDVFEDCRRRFSSRVALLHDYPLYEFTIIVRK